MGASSQGEAPGTESGLQAIRAIYAYQKAPPRGDKIWLGPRIARGPVCARGADASGRDI